MRPASAPDNALDLVAPGIAVRVQVPGEPFRKLLGGFSAAPRLVLKQDN